MPPLKTSKETLDKAWGNGVKPAEVKARVSGVKAEKKNFNP
jgi:hypothetical protein